ncbi:Putative fluoride ion transporter CrcB [Nocardioides dokdonensis FR1436]|uniref:Fluoride-specific ion channel FluC n=1 Tax=Nocardioides dokdonensis FR1436 TaxID=1300347 RepID=A0A1A9GGE8_9ACTN|nr:CrcB family protein [Nocardioides dokdonensis]ANH37304.1 Putative fluoride ion transporter CrcB [Nocardioides dokdonensis FR1436]
MSPPASSGASTGASPGVPHGASALAAVAIGGASGAVLRWSIGAAAPGGDAVLAVTLVVNVVGSFALAALPALPAVRRRALLEVGLGPGLLGGFTTLSAASEQTRSLLDAGRVLSAAGYVALTLVASLAAVALARHWSAPRAAVER